MYIPNMGKDIKTSVLILYFAWLFLDICLIICLSGFMPFASLHAKNSESTSHESIPDSILKPETPSDSLMRGVSSKEVQDDIPRTTQTHTATWAFTPSNMPPWQRIEDGLDIGLFPAIGSSKQACNIIIIRVDPAHFDFAVHAISATGSTPMSLGDWATQKDLVLAINASMYLPDGYTSTGYLRVYDHLNNNRIVNNFGAFFVASPREANIPEAQLLDREGDDWENILNQYNMVVQNYRMIDADRRLLWKDGEPEHAISALGRATDGSLLFIHCRDPITGMDFASLILNLPYEINVLMYLEGGAQAGLMLRSPNMNATWLGRDPVEFWTQNNSIAQLPNIIGVYRKKP